MTIRCQVVMLTATLAVQDQECLLRRLKFTPMWFKYSVATIRLGAIFDTGPSI
jgi:hypothetical protein